MANEHLHKTLLDHALELGNRSGWESLTLQDVAQAAGVTLADIYACYPQKDDMVDAWFDRADTTLLEQSPGAPWAALPAVKRIEEAIWCWLSALTPYRKLSGEMLLYKLEPGHIHLQLAELLRISRTVQWLREAAGLKATHGLRVMQESALTAVFVATFIYWLNDRSSAQRSSRQFLQRQLKSGNALKLWR